MYRKTTPRFQVNNENLKTQRRALLIVCAALLVAVGVLGFFTLRNRNLQARVQTQISQRMYSASASALDEVGKLGSIVTSNASARLARVRQYVYYMDQLNGLSVSLAGGESGRLVSADYFTTLYSDLESVETLIQLSTTSTLDARTLLQTHLTELQNALPR
ncbi:MAG: hypothetical protein IJI53_11710 [Clostridia bacterium]|nr:hypothetical protein [Clostridia bacterium]MBR0408696.1 hypothetical protein [Clostridia bacterium]